MVRFTVKNLLAFTLVVALGLAFLAQEPLAVIGASLFCFLSCAGIAYLVLLSSRNLVETVAEAYRQRRISILCRRFRWAHIDGMIIVWTVVTIAITNFVLQNAIGHAPQFVGFGWILGPMLVVAFAWRARSADRVAG